MNAIITIIHVLICLILIVVVLLQSGKAADLAGAFGGVGSQTAFGPRGTATLLSKITTVSAVLFMLTSIGLWMMSAKGQSSVVKAPAAATATTSAPAAKQPTPTGTPAQQQPGAGQPTAQQAQPSTQTPAATPKAPAEKSAPTTQKKPS